MTVLTFVPSSSRTDTAILPLLRTETAIWNEVKEAEEKIHAHIGDILEEWRIIGERLIEIHNLPGNNNRRAGAFGKAAQQHGITLSKNQMATAQWWADLKPAWREKLHEENPGLTAPKSLQDYCRDKYPDEAKRKKVIYPLGVNKKPKTNRGRKIKKPGKTDSVLEAVREKIEADKPIESLIKELGVSRTTIQLAAAKVHGIIEGQQQAESALLAKLPPEFRDKLKTEHPDLLTEESDGDNNTVIKLSSARLKEIAEEEHRIEVRARKQREREAAAGKDDRPRVKEHNIIMYGKQLWPLNESLDMKYDFDQLYFAVHQFNAWTGLLPKTDDHVSRAQRMRERTYPLYVFATRRLPTECKSEVLALVMLMQKLSDLYLENPTGECVLPIGLNTL